MAKRVRPCCTASLTAPAGHEHAFGAVPHVIQRARLGAARATFPVLRRMGHFRLEQYTQRGFHTRLFYVQGSALVCIRLALCLRTSCFLVQERIGTYILNSVSRHRNTRILA